MNGPERTPSEPPAPEKRPHRGLKLTTPITRVAQSAPRGGKLHRNDVLGGIIHEYEWAA
ncbi:MAG: hypothetical protein ACYDGN_12405 [Acidimicrobiales bacterium]